MTFLTYRSNRQSIREKEIEYAKKGKDTTIDSLNEAKEILSELNEEIKGNARWDSGWPLELVSQSLGHRHLDTTTRYLNLMDDKLKQASTEFYNKHSALYGVQELL